MFQQPVRNASEGVRKEAQLRGHQRERQRGGVEQEFVDQLRAAVGVGLAMEISFRDTESCFSFTVNSYDIKSSPGQDCTPNLYRQG